MYRLKSEFKLSIEKAKQYAIDKSDSKCYLLNENESALQIIINGNKLIVDFEHNIIYHDAIALHDAIEFKKAIIEK